jgi:hypothetical protein
LLTTYHLPLAGRPKSMDLGLLYSALEQKQVDMAAANATDGMLSVLDVKVLRDDRHYFPPYQAAVIVRAESLAAHPGLRAALDQLAGKLSAAGYARSEPPGGWKAPACRRSSPRLARHPAVKKSDWRHFTRRHRLQTLRHSVKGGDDVDSSEPVGSGGVSDPLRRVRREKGSQCVRGRRPGRVIAWPCEN